MLMSRRGLQVPLFMGKIAVAVVTNLHTFSSEGLIQGLFPSDAIRTVT
jgi:hypothetical protein